MSDTNEIFQGCIGKGVSKRDGCATAITVHQYGEVLSHNVYIEHPTIVQVVTGKKTIYSPDGAIDIDKYSLIIFAGQQSFSFCNHCTPDGGYEARWLIVDNDLLDRWFRNQTRVSPITDYLRIDAVEPEFQRQLDSAFFATENPSCLPSKILEVRISEILTWIQLHGGTIVPRDSSSLVFRLRSMIAEKPDFEWTAACAAIRLAMSEATLRRHLAKQNQSFAAILCDVRMNKAFTLILSTDLSIEMIAEQVGYNDPSKFSARFSAHFGHLPSILRGHKRQIDRIGV